MYGHLDAYGGRTIDSIPKWEYLVVHGEAALAEKLNDYGKRGWELVTIVAEAETLVFKRILPVNLPYNIKYGNQKKWHWDSGELEDLPLEEEL